MNKDLTPQNLDNLPMFNVLNAEAYVPRNTVFVPSLFSQAQGSMQPRHNQGVVVKQGHPIAQQPRSASLFQTIKNALF